MGEIGAFDHRGRLARARDHTTAEGLDALLVTPGPDLLYLIGYDPPPLERLTVLVIRPEADPVLLVPELERPRAERSPAKELVAIETWPDGADPPARVAAMVGDADGRIGLSDRTWAVHLLHLQAAMSGRHFVPGSSVLSALRVRKDAEEIRLLGLAGAAADEAFHSISRERLSGRSEREVARSLGEYLLSAGHESVGFTIVAAGPHGASPHHEPGHRTIREGDAVVMDFGGRVGGYCSDMTRTVSVGEPSEEVREVHEVVRVAQQAAFDAVAPGLPARDVDLAAREVIARAGYGHAFVHRTGHGIGLEEHEDPYIVEGNDLALEAGMSFSIEPGIYLEGRFGVRIEDIVVVTDEGAAGLNRASRELLVVG
jgi:Xaa-Pro aminopeptidase